MKETIIRSLFSFSFCVALSMQGCKDENTIDIGGLGSVYDPAVKPEVIFTYPGNNTIGPFSGIFSGEDNNNYPHFKIQFNKIMNTVLLNENIINIKGFDEPVRVYPTSYYPETGIYQFRVSTNNGNTAFYQLGKTYTVTVPASLEDVHNQTIGRDYTFSFTIGTSFKVISSFPKDSFSVGGNEVKLVFNSQVDTSIFSKINFSPSLPGYWYITNSGTTIYYYPNNSYSSNTTYTVTVAAGAKDKFGNVLGASYSYSFKTGEFKIISSYPSNGDTYFSLTNNLSFYCNSSFLYSSLSTAFSISPSTNGNFQAYGNYFGFQPLEPLKEKTTYTVTLSTDLSSTTGNKLTNPYSITFTTEGFRINQFYPYNSPVSRYSNVEVQFNSPIDTSTAKTGVSILPAVAGKIYFSNKNRTLIFRPDSIMAANTQYIVTLSTVFKSAQGNPLENNYSYSFTTGD